jgi:hypothetical protein
LYGCTSKQVRLCQQRKGEHLLLLRFRQEHRGLISDKTDEV